MAAARAARASDKEATAHALHQQIIAISNIHREGFPLATRPFIPMPPPIDAGPIFERHEQLAKGATRPFGQKRKDALAEAQLDAEKEFLAATATQTTHRVQAQRAADAVWQLLEACDPDVTLDVLAAAFSDNDAAAAAVGITGTQVSLVVIVPREADVPDRMPTTTQAGNLSLKKLTKAERAHLYTTLVCGHLIVTLREAFAVAPALTSAQIVAVRATPPDVYGTVRAEAILAGHCDRTALEGVRWQRAESVEVFNECLTSRLIVQTGASRALQPIPAAGEPELAALLDAVRFDLRP
ncbi:hypothetical protein [Cellulomonas sp. P5_C5]